MTLSNVTEKARQGFSEAKEAVHSKLSKLDNLDEVVKIGKPLSVALMIGGVALTILGIVACASGGFAAIIGAPAILAGLSACYFGYNGYQVLENLSGTFNKGVVKGADALGLSDMAGPVLKSRLAKNTFCFD